jgi:hypothetical protein
VPDAESAQRGDSQGNFMLQLKSFAVGFADCDADRRAYWPRPPAMTVTVLNMTSSSMRSQASGLVKAAA